MELYDTIQDVSNASPLGAWSWYWTGRDGCSTGSPSTLTQTNYPQAPIPSKDQYPSVDVRVSRDSKSHKGIRRGYPPYRYTPYHISTETTKRFLVRRRTGGNGYNVFYQRGYTGKEGGTSCHRVLESVTCTGPVHSTWTIVTHDYSGYYEYILHGFDSSDISNAIGRVQAQVQAQALTSYDTLTEIAEMREVPGMLASMSRDIYSILQGMRGRFGKKAMRAAASIPIRELVRHPSRILRKLGDEWMTYRYGIMPLLYSCQDIIKTMDRGCDTEERCSEYVAARDLNPSLPDVSQTFRRTRIEGGINIRGCIFQHFTSTEVSRLAGLGFNPFVTAWELIPYSFVVDWFVNAGDYIAAKTGASFAQQKWACLSRRDKYKVITEVHLPAWNVTCTMPNKLPTGWLGAQPPPTDPVVIENPEGYQLIIEKEVDSYSRWLFDVYDAHLIFKPTLNWRRLLDSAVMSLNFVRSFMRSLR